MNKSELWKEFYSTGAVDAYLKYALAPTEDTDEAEYRRTDNKKQKNG